MSGDLAALREEFHRELCRDVLGIRGHGSSTAVYSNADSYQATSVDFAARLASRLPAAEAPRMKGSEVGSAFERTVLNFVRRALALHPAFDLKRMRAEPGRVISDFAQFAHLAEIEAVVKNHPELEATLGGHYLVKPDLVVSWDPFDDRELSPALDPARPLSTRSPTRRESPGAGLPILHASISCKWSIRSDRVQNTRTEALNLVRNRKGRTPHIVLVTMEPDPKRLSAIAIGTGDIDCVYHAALEELREGAAEAAEATPARSGAHRRLEMMVSSSRLRDIADLPLDLLV
jgi:NgoMIV restriction enzyme